MKNLLFLVHRIPYPPNKGDKIRSYNFLKGLTNHYNIHLATFIDDADDWQYAAKVEELTMTSLFINLRSTQAKIKSLSGLLNGKALSLPYYQSQQMQKWIDKTMKEKSIDKVFIFSSAMAQYIEKYPDLDVVVDFVDVDSDKWRQYSQKSGWPMTWVYRREAKLLLEYDTYIAKKALMSIFVSNDEALLFKRLTGMNDKITYVNNGVDIVFFDPFKSFVTPYDDRQNIIVFTGAMDYWANIDAVTWFVSKVFPLIKQQYDDAKFYIVGSNPTKDVLQLATVDGVVVTGRVDDIRAYLLFANVVVAPLLIARGIQNKILEAMAMGKKIVATPQAIEGININNQQVYVTEKISDFSTLVLSNLIDTQNTYFSAANRDFVASNYSWSASLDRLIKIIDNE